MKSLKNKFIVFLSSLLLIILFSLSISNSRSGLNFSFTGFEVLANGFTTITCYEWGVQNGNSCIGQNGCWDGIDELSSFGCSLQCMDETIIFCPTDD